MNLCCNNGVVVSWDRLFRSASTEKLENKKKRCWPALRQKKVPAEKNIALSKLFVQIKGLFYRRLF